MAKHNRLTINPEAKVPGSGGEKINTVPEKTQEQEPQATNTAEQNVENAKIRIEDVEGRGAEIRTRAAEKIKTLGKRAVSKLDRGIGHTASGAEKLKDATVSGAEKARDKIADTREYASNLKDAATERMSQRQARKERKRTDKERAKSDAYRNEQAEIAAQKAREQAESDSVYDEAHRENLNRDWQTAKQEHMDGAHEEALEENERRDAEEREKMERELQATEDISNRVESFLKSRYKKEHGKNLDLDAIYAELSSAFPSREKHLENAIDDAFNVFAGKKTKQAVRAARIAKGKAKFAETRHKSYETVRDRSSEAYQSALKSGKKIGKSIARFSRRTASAAKAGFSVARDTWNASKEAPTAETSPATNE